MILRGPHRRSEINHVHTHGITSLRTEAEMNRKGSEDEVLESVLQEFCVVEGITYYPIVDCGQCRSHRFSVLSNLVQVPG